MNTDQLLGCVFVASGNVFETVDVAFTPPLDEAVSVQCRDRRACRGLLMQFVDGLAMTLPAIGRPVSLSPDVVK